MERLPRPSMRPDSTKLHAQFKPPDDEAWWRLPWQDSALEARALAVAKKKPVYMLVRSGNPLGCV